MRIQPFDFLVFGAMCVTTSLLAACAAAPVTAPPLTAVSPSPSGANAVLPAPVYCLRDGQIWRLARDGRALVQITHERTSVDSFDVSPVDGALVYVTHNTLVLSDALGQDRRVLLTGPELPPAQSELAALNDPAHIVGAIRTPIWSSDGAQLAYVQNGLNVMTFPDGNVERLWANPSISSTSEIQLVASAVSWSLDGRRLLSVIYPYPLHSLYNQMLALKTASYLVPLAQGVDITAAWSADGTALYLANPSFGGIEALRRCAADDGRCAFIGEEVPARWSAFYKYPCSTAAGRIFVFMASTSDPAQPPKAYKLVSLAVDGSGRSADLTDAYDFRTALWAQDGRGLLIVQASTDSLLWLSLTGARPVELPVTGARALRWGHQGQ